MSVRLGVVDVSWPRNWAITGLNGCAASSVKSPARTPAVWNVARSKRGDAAEGESAGRSVGRQCAPSSPNVGNPVNARPRVPVMRVSAPIGRPAESTRLAGDGPFARNRTSATAVVESWNSFTLSSQIRRARAIGSPSSDSSTREEVLHRLLIGREHGVLVGLTTASGRLPTSAGTSPEVNGTSGRSHSLRGIR